MRLEMKTTLYKYSTSLCACLFVCLFVFLFVYSFNFNDQNASIRFLICENTMCSRFIRCANI